MRFNRVGDDGGQVVILFFYSLNHYDTWWVHIISTRVPNPNHKK